MPSIPQSLLWISLVVLWLFVLVPMLVSRRDTVRRTSDVALATRVLNTGRNARLRRRTRPADGHQSDPHWRPAADEDAGDLDDLEDDRAEQPARRAVVLAEAVAESTEPDYLDVDIVDEDSGALPIGKSFGQDKPQTEELPLDFGDATPEPEAEAEPVAEDEPAEPEAAEDQPAVDLSDGTEDDYEYVDDSSGLEPDADTGRAGAESLSAARRSRYESKTAQAVSARKYAFRRRVLLVMAVLLAATATLPFLLGPGMWWPCGTAAAVTVLYLGYLRRQTRIEEQLRRRRAHRMMRSRLGVENTTDQEYDVVPSRLRRPGAAVLDIDDEDPIFEHLEYTRAARSWDLPRAAGQ
ncbi:divisome protein SepX/GlpR [Mycobacterium sp. BMJ-28]